MASVAQRLGKPRSWWVCCVAAAVALVAGGLLVGLYLAGVESAASVGL
jgi:hypothetical protein